MRGNRLNFDWNDDILRLLSEDELARFRRFKFEKGGVIYAEKIRFIVLLKGELKLSFSEGGRELVLSLLKEGSFVFLDANSTLEAESDCEIAEINIADLRELLANEDFAMSVLNSLVRSVVAQRKLIHDMFFRTTEDRLKSFFCDLVSESESDVVTLPFSVTTLAALCGSPRQNVSTALNKFIKNGQIEKLDAHTYKLKFSNLN